MNPKRRPHAKHTGKDVMKIENGKEVIVAGLPRHNIVAYKYCPWASHKKYVDPGINLPEITEREIAIYNFIKSQFDRKFT